MAPPMSATPSSTSTNTRAMRSFPTNPLSHAPTPSADR